VKCDSTLSFVAGTPQLNFFPVANFGSSTLRPAISRSRSFSGVSAVLSTGERYTWPAGPCHHVVLKVMSGLWAADSNGIRTLQIVVPKVDAGLAYCLPCLKGLGAGYNDLYI